MGEVKVETCVGLLAHRERKCYKWYTFRSFPLCLFLFLFHFFSSFSLFLNKLNFIFNQGFRNKIIFSRTKLSIDKVF